MTPKCDARLLLCIAFVACCCCWTLTMAQIPMDCCLSAQNQTIAKQYIANYRLQLSAQGCPRDAMILVTRRGKNLCVPHDEVWVMEVLKHVEWLQTHCKKSSFKGKRCFGVNPQ
ncbi:monocyte chemotactic protein 1B-like [Nelusetta ayraudi]|uniref:monocyte chemotactic protein 1B-like n=1 Tax=Nelusetta ayraudi TaxID=303726 RepID=UPI003F7055FA